MVWCALNRVLFHIVQIKGYQVAHVKYVPVRL
jgi:hypothetical protein